jgi:FKBP-type peptidyl-prolyl cis-trans isomerase SlyD
LLGKPTQIGVKIALLRGTAYPELGFINHVNRHFNCHASLITFGPDMNITENTVVTIHFTVCSADGTQIDSSREGEPMVVLQGSHYLIQGLEDHLVGKKVGDKFVLDVEPALAYGERLEELVQAVEKSMFADMEVAPGMTFRATTDDGEQSVMIIDVTEDAVIIDGNHPLSGLTLNFDVEVLAVREASAEEIAHGHPHSEGGCGHAH